MLSPIAANLGAGSGIDTASLVSDLAAASRTPKIRRFEALAQSNQAKISALGQARSDLESFASSLADLVAGGTLRSQPSVSDANALSVTISGGVQLANLSAQIEITQLARAQSVTSVYIPAASGTVGQGELTLNAGGTDYSIVIGADNNSLTGLAQAINAAGSGVTASVVTDTNGARVVLKGATGANNAFSLTSNIGSDPALDRFTHTPGGGQMALGQSSADAQFKIDGIAYSRPGNAISDAISGVTLNLKKADPGAVLSIGATRPLDTIRQTIDDFVSVFNSVKTNISAARTATGGDYALRKLDQQITGLIAKSLTSHDSINSMSDIGISTGRDGTIALDKTKFEAILAADPDAVEALFNPARDADHTDVTDPGIAGVLSEIKDTAIASNGTLDGLRKRLSKESDAIAANRAKAETREDAYRIRLEKQFGSMDSRIAALKATQSYLQQQIEIWNNNN
jgi:flagellar hook-associated protein 2